AIVSALGATTAVVISDRAGRFELRTLTPGPYLGRAHLSRYIAPRGQGVEMRSSARTASTLPLPPAPSTPPTGPAAAGLPVRTAGVPGDAAAQPTDAAVAPETADRSPDNHGEIAWRLRHARRGILKDADIPDEIFVSDTPPNTNIFGHGSMWDYVGSPARMATNFFTETPFSGQFNLLTTGSLETPLQFFTADNFARSVAYVALGAPVGDRGDWTVRAALTQGDIASWIVAGEYTTRAPARHRYDFGWSYATQRYDGGNVAALRDVTDGSRNAGLLFGYDTYSVTPIVTLSYGGRWARYDYLENGSLLSPRLSITVEPIDHFRVSGVLSRRAVAPGAEEFIPRMDSGVWLPPQR